MTNQPSHKALKKGIRKKVYVYTNTSEFSKASLNYMNTLILATLTAKVHNIYMGI